MNIWNNWVLQRSHTRLYRTSKDFSGTLASLSNSQLASTTTTSWNIVKSCSLVVCVEWGGEAIFYRWRGGDLPWNILLMPSWMYQTTILDALNLDETLGTHVGKVVWTDWRRLDSREASRCAPAPWVRLHLAWATLSLVSSWVILWSSRMTLWKFCAN